MYFLNCCLVLWISDFSDFWAYSLTQPGWRPLSWRKLFNKVFTARCYASAVLATGLCPSVCLCLCLSQAGVLLKRQNIGSHHKQHHTIPPGTILKPKISAKFDRGHPYTGAPNAGGVGKIGDFPQITVYISKKVQDRRMVSIKVE